MNVFFVITTVAAAVVAVNGRSLNSPTKFSDTKSYLSKSDTKSSSTIRVGAFNIKTFGKAKMSDPVVAGQIVEILVNYDVILIQEIRDVSMESVVQLFDMLNERVPMNYLISERLGRTSYKEQYAFFYKTEFIAMDGHHQFDDAPEDIFEREPYSVLMRVKSTGLLMTLVALHVKPDDAVIEITELQAVYYDVLSALGSSNVVIMGDLNAGCSYAKEEELDGTYVFSDTKFTSLIPHTADTTVSNTVCAYDRIIVSGDLAGRVTHSDVHLFDVDLDLDQSEALKVSDHYPVEMTLTV